MERHHRGSQRDIKPPSRRSDTSPSLWKCNRLLFRKIIQTGVEDFFNGLVCISVRTGGVQFCKLNDMHIPARKGQWSQTSVANILTNEVYLGKIRWRREPVKKVIKDGMLSKKRIQNDEYELYDGLHEPIITEEQWERVKAAQKQRNHNPVNSDRQLKNPFAGILFCGKCGAVMKRMIPDKHKNPTPWYRCTTRGCDCKIIKCAVVESEIKTAMEEWLDAYMVQIKADQQPEADPVTAALETIRGQIAGLQHQQESICEYLEKGVYTIDMFTKRNTSLSKEIKQLQLAEADLIRQQNEKNQKEQQVAQIIPTTQHILESYPLLEIEEKNRMWKLVMKKATVYRSPDDKLEVNIYPNLPK